MLKDDTIYSYGFDDGKAGIEAHYLKNGDTLYMKIYGANNYSDYLNCLLSWPRRRLKHNNLQVHPIWDNMAKRLVSFIRELNGKERLKNLDIIGHSMGGAVGTLVAYYLEKEFKDIKLTTVNSPKAGNKHFDDVISYSFEITYKPLYDAGDIIRFFPVFYKRYNKGVAYADTSGIVKAHNNMPEDWTFYII